MSLVFIDGFDNAGSGTSTSKWTTGSYVNSAAARVGGAANGAGSTSGGISKQLTAAQEHATLILGVGMLPSGISSFTTALELRSDGGATTHISVSFTNTGGSVTRGGTVVPWTAPPGVTANTWYYLELKATLSDTVGAFELRINGATVLSQTGVDTKNAGTKTVFDNIRINGAAVAVFLDDLYLCNGAGTVNNDFLGDCVVESIYPNNNGDVNQFVGSDGNSVDNYLLVDEPGNPVTTDYASSGTAGQQDLYQMTDLTRSLGSVRGIQVSSYINKDDAGVRDAKLLVKTGGTIYSSAAVGLTTSAAFKLNMLETNPATSALWLPAEVNAVQAGVEVI